MSPNHLMVDSGGCSSFLLNNCLLVGYNSSYGTQGVINMLATYNKYYTIKWHLVSRGESHD
eukprot:scaffold96310_cov43-Attheya_sp.AAC.2